MKKAINTLVLTCGLFFTITAQTAYKDVAGVFYARCTSCHHEGANPYSFMNFTSVKSFSSSISNALSTNAMPPWQPDTSYTRFQHERIITASEKSKILSWISAGVPQGDTTQAPPPPVYSTNYSLHGQADLTLKIPTYTSTATSSDKYVCFSLSSGLTQDRIIRAFEIVPGNPIMVHHAVITADSTGLYTGNLSGSCFNIPGNMEIGAYAPGTRATVFPGKAPLKAGIRLKAGSKVILQIHYPKGTSGMVDSTKIRLFFYPFNETGIRNIQVSTPLQNWSMFIPANTTQTFTAYYPSASTGIPNDLSLFGIFPHSHEICESTLNYALNPGIDTIPLARINHWDFHWQDYYYFKKLVKVPAGYRLFARHVFNNTASNHHNPNNPPVNVQAGTSTSDEMLFDGIMALPYQSGDELIDIEGIIASDPLLGIKENKWFAEKVRAIAFPNPFNGNVKINYLIPESGPVSLEISDITGRIIYEAINDQQHEGIGEFNWQAGHNTAKGIYFYRIKTQSVSVSGKLVKN